VSGSALVVEAAGNGFVVVPRHGLVSFPDRLGGPQPILDTDETTSWITALPP
jgi:hypothetical protein